MAKNESKAPSKKGVGSRDWRGHTVFFCLTPGCVADSEVRGNIERHVQRGKHRIHGKIVKSAPVPVAKEDDAKEGVTDGEV